MSAQDEFQQLSGRVTKAEESEYAVLAATLASAEADEAAIGDPAWSFE